ncbi:MAG TPA: PAS domain S-box protein [Candidatus Krumholzibacteriaceae bacterium]|nr:PAS domain S-box protein [Candidatus Krumholzibacteriaceae bacterium]
MKLKSGNKFIIAGFIASLIFWVFESLMHAVLLHRAGIFKQLFNPGTHELWMRLLVVVLIMLLSCYYKKNYDLVSKKVRIEDIKKALSETSTQINFDKIMDKTLRVCLDTVLKISDMDSGGVYLLDEETEGLSLARHEGWSSEFVESANYYNRDSEILSVIKRGEVSCFTRDQLTEVLSSEQMKEPIRLLAVIPLQSEGRLIGSLLVASHDRTNATIIELERLEQIAAQISNIIGLAAKAKMLVERENKFRLIVENAREGIAITDQDFRFVYVNDELCRIFQRDREELIGQDFRGLLSKESRSIVADRYIRRQSGYDAPDKYEATIIRKNGEKRIIEVSSSVILTAEGPLSIGLILDLSQRKRAEEKYRKLFNSSKDAIMVLKPPEWQFKAWNPAAYELFDMEENEPATSITPWEMSPQYQPDGQDSSVKARKIIDTALREGEHYFEWTHRSRGGRLIPAKVNLVRIELDGEDCLLATIRDITDSKKAELQLIRLRNHLTSIINSMPSVLISIDTDFVVTHCNKHVEEITGICSADSCGKNLLDLYPEMEDIFDNIKKVLSSGEIQKDIKVVRFVNDNIYYKNITVYPIVSDDITGAVIREDDVTDREKLQELLVQSDKMMSLGGLSAGMAHEINTPLTVIIQNATVAMNRLMKNIPDNIKTADELGLDLALLREYAERRDISEMIDGIVISGKRAANIVRDMLSFARKEMPEKVLYSVNELLSSSIDLVGQDKSLELDSVNINMELDPDLPNIMCVPGKIKQVFFNVLKNGAEAMKKKEAVEYKREFKLRTYRDYDWACIEIEDNGPGMDEYVRRRVFEPFFTTKDEGAGSGLGMSVAYFIIADTHAGTMKVESKNGEWTRFIIKLPFDE